MDSREVTGWMVHERLNGPLGALRFDYLFAQLQATIANANRGKRGKSYKPSDFAPRWADTSRWPWSEKEQTGPQSDQEMLEVVKSLHRAMGGR